MEQKIRVRFAPSPTGPLHIGSARTALFNYLYAKKQGGVMVLRIEDTDTERNQESFVEDIKDNLTWLGITWDEFYRQSERNDTYKQAIDKLIAEDKAYMKDGACWMRVTPAPIIFDDLIRGRVEFPAESQEDFVIVRSNGQPVFHFVNVMDDALMKISHVIRGEDHLSNTPRHILIYRALGYDIPKFAHMPLIHNAEGGKMSKRSGDTAVTAYREAGYLPQAIDNFLALLGWSPANDKQFFTLDDAIAEFDIAKVKKSPAVFDIKKLNHINHYYLQQLSDDEYYRLASDYIQDWPDDETWHKTAIGIFRGRAEYFEQLREMAKPILELADYSADLLIFKKSDAIKALQGLQSVKTMLEETPDWQIELLKIALEKVATDTGLTNGDIFWPTRVALSGAEASPPPQELLVLLGKDEALRRINQAISKLNGKS